MVRAERRRSETRGLGETTGECKWYGHTSCKDESSHCCGSGEGN